MVSLLVEEGRDTDKTESTCKYYTTCEKAKTGTNRIVESQQKSFGEKACVG